MKIEKTDLERTTNYILVNSQSEEAINYSVEFARKVIEQDNKMKVVVLPETKNKKNISIKGIGGFGRGKIGFIDKGNMTNDEAVDYLVPPFKYGLIIISNKDVSTEKSNNFNNNSFFKKSIDLIVHSNSLFINTIEKKSLDKQKNLLKEGNKLIQNWSFRIYKDENFSPDKETFKRMLELYGTVDAAGIMFTQHFVNNENFKDDFAYYQFFARRNNIFGKYPETSIMFVEMLINLGFDEKSIEAFMNIFYESLTKDFAERFKKDHDKQEKNGELKEIKEELDKTDEEQIEAVLDEFIPVFLEKIEKKEMTMMSVISKPNEVADFVLPYYNKIKGKISLEKFMKLFQEKIVTMFS